MHGVAVGDPQSRSVCCPRDAPGRVNEAQSDRHVRSQSAAPGKRVEVWDTRTPCFGIRVTDKGHKTYILYLRWSGSRNAARREIGNADRMSLSAARKRTREWLKQVELGVDPREQVGASILRRQRERQTSFAVVAEAWLASIGNQRKAVEVTACPQE